MQRLPITVIIPTMNRPQSLVETLQSMTMYDYVPSQIIVVDQTKDLQLKEENQKNINDMSQLTEISYVYLTVASITKARNEGLKVSKNEIIVFSDDDIEIENNTFLHVFELMNDSSVALIGGHDKNTPLTHRSSILSYFFCKTSFRKRKMGHVSSGIYGNFPSVLTDWVNTEWAMGFFFVVRKSLIDRWGLYFDEKLMYYAYAEDLDFTYSYYIKAKNEGLRCGMSKLLSVNHKVSREYRVPKYSATMMEVLHRYYILKKHDFSFCTQILMWWCNVGIFFHRAIHKERPRDVLKAVFFLRKNRVDVAKAEFHYDSFM